MSKVKKKAPTKKLAPQKPKAKKAAKTTAIRKQTKPVFGFTGTLPKLETFKLKGGIIETLKTKAPRKAGTGVLPGEVDYEVLASKAAELVIGVLPPTARPLAEAAATAIRQVATSSLFGLSVPAAVQRVAYRLGELHGTGAGPTKSMDPRLQMLVARARCGLPRAATASSSAQELPVVAKVNNLAAWESLSEVRIGATIGQSEDGHHIVTARIPVSRVEAVRAQPCIVSLKSAQPVRPTLAATLQETHARADLLPAAAKPKGGKGVVVGIVDFGGDFAHGNFRNANGSTRLEAIWHQAASGVSNSSFGYGRVFRTADINAALKTQNPYIALGYGPEPDSLNVNGTHGTHVMDIAAGNGRGSGTPGCAAEAALIFVDLAADDVPWTGIAAVGKSFGDSVRLLEALKFIFTEAGNRPCVINLSLGTNGGPHDGSTLVDQGIDALIREKPNRAVVIAASNSHADGIHAGGTVPVGGSADLAWVQSRDFEPAELEIWLPGATQAAIELLAPDGTSIGLIEPGDSRQFSEGNQILVFIANRLAEPNNSDNSIGIFLAGAFAAGTWTARLHARGAVAVPFHGWIERYDTAQSSFAEPHDNSRTLGSISCGHETVVVGSYDAHKPTLPLSWFSSEGPTRDGREKPELSGPGHDVEAAWSRTGTNVTRKSGTSMAAPAVSGIIALLYAEAARKGRSLSSAELRAMLIAQAKKTPPAGGAWDPRYGHGRISADVLSVV
jgi:subtilisin family serine protease